MDISVIICTYNRGESLRNVLDDLVGQEAVSGLSYEIVIVDNNSGDSTRSVCEEYLALKPDIFRYILEPRQGKTFALNTGIRASRGNIIAFTDDDVCIDSRWLLSIKEAFALYPDCKAFGGRVLPLWPDLVPSWIAREGAFRNIGGTIVAHDYGEEVKSYSSPGMWPPIGANMFFAQEIFRKYGYFNEGLDFAATKIPMLEDTEFCNRLLKGEEAMLYLPAPLVYHPVCKERLTKKYFRKHAFKSGRAQYLVGSLQRNSRYVLFERQKNDRRLYNIPLYFFKNVLSCLVKGVVAACMQNPRKSFYFEKLLVYYTGTMYELFRQRKTAPVKADTFAVSKAPNVTM